MKINKKYIKKLKKQHKNRLENSKIKKPMRPIFFIRGTDKVDWGRTLPFFRASI